MRLSVPIQQPFISQSPLKQTFQPVYQQSPQQIVTSKKPTFYQNDTYDYKNNQQNGLRTSSAILNEGNVKEVDLWKQKYQEAQIQLDQSNFQIQNFQRSQIQVEDMKRKITSMREQIEKQQDKILLLNQESLELKQRLLNDSKFEDKKDIQDLLDNKDQELLQELIFKNQELKQAYKVIEQLQQANPDHQNLEDIIQDQLEQISQLNFRLQEKELEPSIQNQDQIPLLQLIEQKNKEIEIWKQSCTESNYQIQKMSHQYSVNTFETSHWRERASSLQKEKQHIQKTAQIDKYQTIERMKSEKMIETNALQSQIQMFHHVLAQKHKELSENQFQLAIKNQKLNEISKIQKQLEEAINKQAQSNIAQTQILQHHIQNQINQHNEQVKSLVQDNRAQQTILQNSLIKQQEYSKKQKEIAHQTLVENLDLKQNLNKTDQKLMHQNNVNQFQKEQLSTISNTNKKNNDVHYKQKQYYDQQIYSLNDKIRSVSQDRTRIEHTQNIRNGPKQQYIIAQPQSINTPQIVRYI